MKKDKLFANSSLVGNEVFVRYESLYIRHVAKPIINIILDYLKIPPGDMYKIKVANRHPGLVMIRQLMCYFLRQETKLSLRQIGLLLDLDHSTVMYSIKEINRDITPLKNGAVPDPSVRRMVNEINEILKFNNK